MERGKKVTGRLQPLYDKVGGRDRLAILSGVKGQTLSAYNSGARDLGIRNARRITEAAGVDLSALWDEEPPEFSASMLGRLVRLLEENPSAHREVAPLLEQVALELAALSRRLRQVAKHQAAGSHDG